MGNAGERGGRLIKSWIEGSEALNREASEWAKAYEEVIAHVVDEARMMS